ncbi:MAG: MATE family efflux transporter [Anaerovoracaceae bacterium]|jgi:putative MATE family efflux protein
MRGKDENQKTIELQDQERRRRVDSEVRRRERVSDVTKMGETPIRKLLISMSAPAMISMTINALYNTVDSIFVGMISSKALTAVSIVQPVQMLMIALGVGSAVGVNSLIARRLGARRLQEADQAASTAPRIGILNALIFITVGILFAKPFMASYTSDPTIFRYGLSYLRIVTILCGFSMIDIQFEKVLQATGNMMAPMIISISGAVVNIVLDPIFIFGLFGMPRLEVTGAAVATVTGQFVAMTLAILIFFHKERDVKIKIRGFKIDWSVVKDIYAVGFPSIIMQSIGSIMLFGYNKIIAESAIAVAVLGVYFKLQSFVFMPVFGLNQGAMPIMGFNYGARDSKRLMSTYKNALLMALVIMAAGCALFQLIPSGLLHLFSADEEMLRIGVPALRLISLCFIPAAFGIMCSTLF